MIKDSVAKCPDIFENRRYKKSRWGSPSGSLQKSRHSERTQRRFNRLEVWKVLWMLLDLGILNDTGLINDKG